MYATLMIILLVISYLISKTYSNYRTILIATNTIASIIYICWRITVIPIHHGIPSLIFGIILFLSEVLGLFAFFNFQFLFAKNYNLDEKTLSTFKHTEVPSVDVLICTYNEPLFLLKKTIAACTNLNYPKEKLQIYICDDGNRLELKNLCEEFEINYITRTDNKGSKAGNINNALKFIKGDLFAILDADMIPKKNFLEKTVGYFSNENMSFVQVPQSYYNKDMYQYNLSQSIPNEQDFFMRDIQQARAARNSVLHVGTNAVFRKKFIDEVGGYPIYSLTEDMAVGMLLQSKGYDSVLVNEELVLGLSATTFTELVKQRDRWCRGNLQVFKHSNPLTTKGLSFGQKLTYLDGAIYWFANLQKIVYIISPLIFLLTSTLLLDTSLKELLNIYIPFLLGQVLIFKLLSSNTRSLKWAHYYEVSMAPHLSFSILKELFSIKTRFNVTSKEITLSKKTFQFPIVLPHIILVAVSIIAWLYSFTLTLLGKMNFVAFGINFIWSSFNFLGAIISLRVAYQKPIFRSSERINIDEDICLTLHLDDNTSIEGKLLDISGEGMGIRISDNLNIDMGTKLRLTLHNVDFNCNISRLYDNFIGLNIDNPTSEQMKVIMSIFVDNMRPYYKVNA